MQPHKLLATRPVIWRCPDCIDHVEAQLKFSKQEGEVEGCVAHGPKVK